MNAPSAPEPIWFAETTFRNARRRVGIKPADRLSHMHILGKTGVGKSSLLEVLIRQDIKRGNGFALIDPHGDLAERIWTGTPEALRERITYLDAPSRIQPFGYNPLRRVADHRIPLAASGLLETFRKLWPNAWGVRMEHVLRNSLYALLEHEGSTLPDILTLFADKSFRRAATRNVRNHVVRASWRDEFEKYPARLRAEATVPIQNKLGALLANPTLYRILAEPAHDLRFRSIMDERRGLLVNLSRGELGEDATLLLGGVLVTMFGMAAFSRADTAVDLRSPFFVYVDEFQNFTTLAFANMISELRKYGVGLTLSHQHLGQLDQQIAQAVLGNAGTRLSFRVGADDAAQLSREFAPSFAHLTSLAFRTATSTSG